MKLKKKSGLIGIVVALSAASLISVGFASWVISQGDSKTVDGSIEVDAVNDKRHTITLGTPSASVIRFGHKADAGVSDPWLTNDDLGAESLSFNLTISVDNVESTFAYTNLTVELEAGAGSGNSFVPESGSSTGYGKAASDGLVAALPDVVASLPASGSGIVFSGESVTSNTYSATITVTFNWGSVFGNTNPYTFYNSHNVNDIVSGTTTYGDHALANLGALKTDLTGVTYRLTVSVADNPSL